jgi:predicted nucleic acid-binding protein
MSAGLIIDTGPIVALLNRTDTWHSWTVSQLQKASPPLITCEAVLSEAFFILSSVRGGPERLIDALRSNAILCRFDLPGQVVPVCALLSKYADVPMSLADACLIRMSELNPGLSILTLDSDFRVYRRNGRRTVPAVLP